MDSKWDHRLVEHLHKIERKCQRRLGHLGKETVDDGIQEVSLAIVRALRNGAEIRNFGAWVRQTADYRCLDILDPKREAHLLILDNPKEEDSNETVVADIPSYDPPVDDHVDKRTAFLLFTKFLLHDVRGRRQKTILYASLQGMQQAAIAQSLHISESLVSYELSSLRKQIQNIDFAYQQLNKHLSELQKQILFLFLKGEKTGIIAKSLKVTDSRISKEKNKILTIWKMLLEDPDDDGGGTRCLKSRRNVGHDRVADMNSPTRKGGPLSCLLFLPALQEAASQEEAISNVPSRVGIATFLLLTTFGSSVPREKKEDKLSDMHERWHLSTRKNQIFVNGDKQEISIEPYYSRSRSKYDCKEMVFHRKADQGIGVPSSFKIQSPLTKLLLTKARTDETTKLLVTTADPGIINVEPESKTVVMTTSQTLRLMERKILREGGRRSNRVSSRQYEFSCSGTPINLEKRVKTYCELRRTSSKRQGELTICNWNSPHDPCRFHHSDESGN